MRRSCRPGTVPPTSCVWRSAGLRPLAARSSPGPARRAGPGHVAPDGGPAVRNPPGLGPARPKNPVPGLDVAGTVVAAGADVTEVCSTAKTDLVTSIGADDVLDCTRDDFADGSQRYDLILDIAGNSPVSRLRRALTPAGTLVLAGGEDGGRWTGMGRQLRACPLTVHPPAAHHAHLRAAPRRPGDSHPAHRGWPAHSGHRQDLPAAADRSRSS